MAYKKPQDPLTNNGFGIYPLTTADQVILSDGSRLEKNGQISIGGGTVKTVSGVAPDSAGNVTLTAGDVGALAADGTASDSSKLGGRTWAERLLDIYPVGSIYMSVASTSPASLFGGTWESIGGRFLLGADATYAAGSTGGEATHRLTVDEMPSHTHTLNASYSSAGTSSSVEGKILSGDDNNGWLWNFVKTTIAGGSAAHNNMPPYLAAYVWKRVS